MYPGTPIGIDPSVIIPEKLGVQGRETLPGIIMCDYGSILGTQFFPRTHRTVGTIPVDIAAGLAIAEIEVITAIRPLNDIGGPKVSELDLVKGRHLHGVVVPINKILAVPYRGDP